MNKIGTFLTVAALALMAGACTSKSYVVHAPPMEESLRASALAGQPVAPYRLQVGDKLNVRFYRNPELDQEVVIRPDGKISLPYVDDVQAAGRSPAELDVELSTRYTGELANPSLTVVVVEYGVGQIFIGGEVKQEGLVNLGGGMTLYQAIVASGGFADSARRSAVVLLRRNEDGERIAREIDVRPIATGANPGDDVPLQPFDMVLVPRSGVTNVNLWVQQYIRDNLPINVIPLFN
jgi:protein involved in polysaccharide export with SLBB domain